ncbi:hypothetical protein ACVOMV_30085 [Mesorhizobium atlanticum]
MFFSLIAIAAVIALFVIVSRQQNRIALVERELGVLRGLVQSGASLPAPKAAAHQGLSEEVKVAASPVAPLADGTTMTEEGVATSEVVESEAEAGPWTKAQAAGGDPPSRPNRRNSNPWPTRPRLRRPRPPRWHGRPMSRRRWARAGRSGSAASRWRWAACS